MQIHFEKMMFVIGKTRMQFDDLAILTHMG